MIPGARRRFVSICAELLVALAIALSGSGCGGRGGADRAAKAAAPRESASFDLDRRAMQADLESWLSTLEAVHPNPYTKIERATFLAELKATRAALPETADPLDFYARLQRLAALLRDSHTEIGYPAVSRAYHEAWWPIETTVRDGRLLVRANIGGLEKGTEITKVNEWPVHSLLKSASALSSAEIEEAARARAPIGMALWLAGGRAPFRVEARLPSGKSTVATFAGLDPSHEPARGEPGPDFGMRWLDSDVAQLAIFSMSDVEGFAKFMAAATAEIVAKRARALIVDLRANSGGNTAVGELLLERITDKPYRMAAEKHWRVSRQYQAVAREVYDPGNAYLRATPGTTLHYRFDPQPPEDVSPRYRGPVCFLIGPGTASSAMMLANAVEDYDLATLIGEPTASPPNYFGEVFVFELPRTKLRAQASVAQFVRANGDASNVAPVTPDIELAPTVEQWARGEDPVLSRALAWVKTGR